MDNKKRLFHYTTASRLRKICGTDEIRQATAHVPPNERPAAWFSFRETFEPSALKGLVDPKTGRVRTASFDELVEIDTPMRIEVDPSVAPLNFATWEKASGVLPRTAQGLRRLAKMQGAKVEDWRVSFEPIGAEHWLAVEAYLNREWRTIDVAVDDTGKERIVVQQFQ